MKSLYTALIVLVLAGMGCKSPSEKIYVVGNSNAKVGFVRIETVHYPNGTIRRVFLWDGEAWNCIAEKNVP